MTDVPSETNEPPEPKNESRETDSEPPETVLDTDRYGHLSLGDGEIVIYDREEPETWVQSDLVVDVGG